MGPNLSKGIRNTERNCKEMEDVDTVSDLMTLDSVDREEILGVVNRRFNKISLMVMTLICI